MCCFKAHTQKTRIERQSLIHCCSHSFGVSKPILRKRGLKGYAFIALRKRSTVSKPILRKRGLKVQYFSIYAHVGVHVSKPILRKRGLKVQWKSFDARCRFLFQSPYSENEDWKCFSVCYFFFHVLFQSPYSENEDWKGWNYLPALRLFSFKAHTQKTRIESLLLIQFLLRTRAFQSPYSENEDWKLG